MILSRNSLIISVGKKIFGVASEDEIDDIMEQQLHI